MREKIVFKCASPAEAGYVYKCLRRLMHNQRGAYVEAKGECIAHGCSDPRCTLEKDSFFQELAVRAMVSFRWQALKKAMANVKAD